MPEPIPEPICETPAEPSIADQELQEAITHLEGACKILHERMIDYLPPDPKPKRRKEMICRVKAARLVELALQWMRYWTQPFPLDGPDQTSESITDEASQRSQAAGESKTAAAT